MNSNLNQAVRTPTASELLANASQEAEPDNKKDFKGEARTLLRRLKAHEPIVKSWKSKTLDEAYEAARRFLEHDNGAYHCLARRRGYELRELYILNADEPLSKRGMALSLPAIGALVKITSRRMIWSKFDAASDTFDDKTVTYDIQRLDAATARSRKHKLLWEIEPFNPEKVPVVPTDFEHEETAIEWVARRNEMLAAMRQVPETRVSDSSCDACRHFQKLTSVEGVCRRRAPDPANASALAERLALPVGRLPVLASFPVTDASQTCGDFDPAGPENADG